jgi:hypothetical protein
MSRPAACSLTAVSCLSMVVAGAAPGLAKVYLLTGAKPDQLILVDPAARKIEQACTAPDAGTGLLTIVPGPDASTAYVIANHWENVAGIDLDTCEQVFRADFSSGDERVKATFAMDISPDGRELLVIQSPVRLELGEYEVQPTRIAVYDTAAGARRRAGPHLRGAAAHRDPRHLERRQQAVRGQLGHLRARPADRRDHRHVAGAQLGPGELRHTGRTRRMAAVGCDRHLHQPVSRGAHRSRPFGPAAFKTGLLSLDLETGAFETKDFEDTSVIIFSTVVNPVRPQEVYGVYTTLSKIDREAGEVLERIELDHTYYTVNVASDGGELYVSGTMSDIAVYDTETFEQLGRIEMPDGADQALASLRLIQR